MHIISHQADLREGLRRRIEGHGCIYLSAMLLAATVNKQSSSSNIVNPYVLRQHARRHGAPPTLTPLDLRP